MRPSGLSPIAVLLFSSVSSLAGQGGTANPLTGDQVIERVSPSAVTILVGKGDGQVAAIGSGIIIRPDGVILTTHHLVNGMREVQVRLMSGEVYDHVEWIASDERRDAAALRISAVGLPVLPVAGSANVSPGVPVFVVSTGAGLPRTASAGILSATRQADEVRGAGSGYRLLQFTAPLAPGSSGGVLVDAQARALGMVVGSISSGQNVNFAVPIDSIVGLGAGTGGTPYTSGVKLQMPGTKTSASPGVNAPPPPAAPPDLAVSRPDQLAFRTLSVDSKTIFIRRERLIDDLQKTDMFTRLGFRFANYGETAEVAVTVDRPFLTFDWTYTLVYQPSQLTLASGTLEAADEFEAGPKLAAVIMYQLAAAAVLPRGALAVAAPTVTDIGKARAAQARPEEALRTCRTVMVESHTIWMKGNLLQDALYVRPEIREWGISIVDSRNAADIYIDITRPFLTYDWVYQMINTSTGAIVGTGKVVAIDGPAAAQRLALEIVGRIRSVRPLQEKKGP